MKWSPTRALAQYTRALAQLVGSSVPGPSSFTPRQVYALMKSYYLSNGLYTECNEGLRQADVKVAAIHELRNPTAAVIEVYTGKLWPGPIETAMQIDGADDAIMEAIQRIWAWSNLGVKKQLAARWLPLCGDLFLACRERTKAIGDRAETTGAYFEVVDPEEVSDFRVDERGYVTFLRHDVATVEGEGLTQQTVYVTTVWDKALGTMRQWRHGRKMDTAIGALGTPTETRELANAGIDFVPWVHIQFRDFGLDGVCPRGLPVIWTCLTKIDAINRDATTIAQLLRHGKPKLAIKSNTVTADGFPVPAPELDLDQDSSGVQTFGDDQLLRLPGNSSIEHLIPNINFASYAAQVIDGIRALEMDLPELAYHRIMDSGEMSGVALRRKLAPIEDRIVETQGNALPGIIRATQMCMTLAQLGRVKGFEPASIGTFEGDDRWAFKIKTPNLIAETDKEKGETAQVYVTVGVPVGEALRRYAGWSEEDAAIVDAKAAARQVAQSSSAAPSEPPPPYRNADPVARAKQRAQATDAVAAKASASLADAAVEAKAQRETPSTGAVSAAIDAIKKRL